MPSPRLVALTVAALFATGAIIQDAAAQAPEPEPESVNSTAPTPWQAPNPPGCAVYFGNTAYHLSGIAQSIVRSTLLCANRLGWHGEDAVGNHLEVFPLGHSEMGCATNIINIISKFLAIISDSQAIAFACFGKNEACLETVTKAARFIIAIGQYIIAADKLCQPPGFEHIYHWNTDIPLRGFDCWMTTWHMVNICWKAVQYIDVAVETCPKAPPAPEAAAVAPEPVPVSSAEGQEIEAARAASGEAPAVAAAPVPEPMPEPVPLAAAGTTTTGLVELGGMWEALPPSSDTSYSIMPSAPAERRLAGSAFASEAEARQLDVLLAEAHSTVGRLLQTFDIDGSLRASIEELSLAAFAGDEDIVLSGEGGQMPEELAALLRSADEHAAAATAGGDFDDIDATKPLQI